VLAEQLVAENCLSQPAEICLFIKIAAIVHSHDFLLGRIASSQKTPNNSRSTAIYDNSVGSTRTVASKSSIGRLYDSVEGGLRSCRRDLTFKFDKNATNLQSPQWRRDWAPHQGSARPTWSCNHPT